MRKCTASNGPLLFYCLFFSLYWMKWWLPIFFSFQLVACTFLKDRTTVGHCLACSPVPSFSFPCPLDSKHLTSTLTLASFFSTNAESAIKLGYMFADWIPCVHMVFIQLIFIWRLLSSWLQRETFLILCKNKCSLCGSLVGVCSSWGSPIAITTAAYPL